MASSSSNVRKGKDPKRYKQIPFRLHINDHRQFKSKCALEGLKLQNVVEACVLAYLDGDEHIRKIIKEHKNMSVVNKKTASWSSREQDRLLDEIADIEENEDDN